MHAMVPTRGCAVPGAHAVHADWPVEPWEVPAGHGVHVPASTVVEMVPGAQSAQVWSSVVEPGVITNSPGEQLVQVVQLDWFALDVYEPAAQLVQT